MKEKILDNYLLICIAIILILITILYFRNNGRQNNGRQNNGRQNNSQSNSQPTIQPDRQSNNEQNKKIYNIKQQSQRIEEQSRYIEKQIKHIQKLHDEEEKQLLKKEELLHIQQEHQDQVQAQEQYALKRQSFMNKQLYPNEQIAQNLADPSSLFMQEKNNELPKDLKISKNIPDVIKVRLIKFTGEDISPLPILSSSVMPENIIMPSA